MGAIVNMEQFVKGQYGTFTITGTGEVEVDAYGIHIDSDAIFSNLEINGEAVDVRAEYIDSVGGTVAATALMTAGEGNYFSKIQLTSGCVTAIKKKP